jgi:hypothetical protein
MDDARQQVESGGPNTKKVLPNEHKTRSKGVAIATLSVFLSVGIPLRFLREVTNEPGALGYRALRSRCALVNFPISGLPERGLAT